MVDRDHCDRAHLPGGNLAGLAQRSEGRTLSEPTHRLELDHTGGLSFQAFNSASIHSVEGDAIVTYQEATVKEHGDPHLCPALLFVIGLPATHGVDVKVGLAGVP